MSALSHLPLPGLERAVSTRRPWSTAKTFWVFAWFPTFDVDVRAICPAGVAAIKEQTTFVDGLLTIITLNIYSPRSSYYDRERALRRALVARLYPNPKLTTVTPGSLSQLRAGRDYTVRLTLQRVRRHVRCYSCCSGISMAVADQQDHSVGRVATTPPSP